VLDEDGYPAATCATCGGRRFHQAPGDRWRCSGCAPPVLPDDAAAMVGWSFCALPPDPDEDGPLGRPQSCPSDDPGSRRVDERPVAEARPEAPLPDWRDDREWIWRWGRAGPALIDRLPVLEAWIASAPPQPLPRCLAALELARIAREHGITVEVALQNGPPGVSIDAQERDSGSTRAEVPPIAETRPGGPLVPEDDDVPPDPRSAPLGRCRACRWIAPLTGRGLCWACEQAAARAAAKRTDEED
jgi:hypothetical protein